MDLSNKSTLLTVSGGVDSVVLAHLFFQAGFSASVAHCNFGLRKEESDGDELFVRQLSEQYGFPFSVTKFETKRFAAEKGISTQMAARDLRYAWFEEVRKSGNLDFIATAHHTNDAFETVLLNLTRGTGLAGLKGISVINNNLLRPLLFASKDEILAYASANHLMYREDSSNSSNDYKRNLIRNEIMPVLKILNPSLEKTYGLTSERIRSADSLLNKFLENWQKEVVHMVQNDLYISIPAIINLDEPTYRLWFILQEFGYTYSQVQSILSAAEGLSGKIFYSASHQVLKDRTHFVVSKRGNDNVDDALLIDKPEGVIQHENLNFEIRHFHKPKEFKIDGDIDAIYFDAGRLVFPLKLRNWVKGDTFCPLGMKGRTKKISDLLIDQKISKYQKQKVKILVNGNEEILWVVGLRTDERYKVTDSTEKIMEVRFREMY